MSTPRYLLLLSALNMSSGLDARLPRHRAETRSVRSVQLISMPGRPSGFAVHKSSQTGETPGNEAAPSAPNDPRDREVSMRKVEEQMRDVLSPTRGTGTALGRNLSLTQTRPIDPIDPPAHTFSRTITVPAWMQSLDQEATRFAPVCEHTSYRPSGFLGIGAEARREIYYEMMSKIACQYGIPVGLFDAMIIRESGYNPLIFSSRKAYGLTQLMAGTAASLGVDRFDVEQNLRGGARYLRRQLDRFGHYHLALAAYNAGPGRILDTVPGIPETRAYVKNVLRNWSLLDRSDNIWAAWYPAPKSGDARKPEGRGVTVLSF